MKLLIDMNLAPRWVNFLTEAAWEAIHLSCSLEFARCAIKSPMSSGLLGLLGV
jgi:hypothetical protein